MFQCGMNHRTWQALREDRRTAQVKQASKLLKQQPWVKPPGERYQDGFEWNRFGIALGT